MLDPVIHNMIKYVQNVEEKDLKDKVKLGFLNTCSYKFTLFFERMQIFHAIVLPKF